MPPRQDIRFCTTPDGVKLAMALYGSGPPLVRAATWLTHIERDPTSVHNRPWIEAMSRTHTYITYDMRGCGLSSRQVDDVSVEAWVRDLETVVDSLGLEHFPLFGMSQGAAISILYAARHPERVSHLILYGGVAVPYFATKDPKLREEGETMVKLAELGWGKQSPAFRRVFVAKFFPHAPVEVQDEFDQYTYLSADAEMAVRTMRAKYTYDVRAEARRLACPTLVLHSRGDQLTPFENGRYLASIIPGARFVPVDTENHTPLPGEACWATIMREIEGFLGTAAPPAKLTPRQLQVLELVAAGRTDKQVAKALDLSPRTVEMHVAGALKALDCSTRAEAVRKASASGLLP